MSALYDNEIYQVCKFHYGKAFLGVFAADQVPTKFRIYPNAMIVNTDKKDEPGEHWVCYFCESPKTFEFFDSYGNLPEFYGLPTFPNLKCNLHSIQSLDSSVCGHYCIYYIHHRFSKISSSCILKYLHQSRNPDKLVAVHYLNLKSCQSPNSNICVHTKTSQCCKLRKQSKFHNCV
jgi:hypothetical protein